jgi:hypothetical protein
LVFRKMKEELTGEKKGPAVVATVVRQQEGEPL